MNAKRIVKDFSPEIVISSGVTPLDFFGCYRIARLAKAKIIYEVGDLWPLTPIELGGYSKNHPFIRFVQWAENYAYKNTDQLISLLPKAKEYMVLHGLADHKFHHIPNGILMEDWSEFKNKELWEDYSIIEDLKRNGKFIIGFTGSHTISNDLYTTLKVAKKLMNTNIHFVFIGDGPEKPNLINFVNDNSIINVTFLAPVKKYLIPLVLSQMDALYAGTQKKSLYRFGVSLNKIFDYMMSGKPIIQAISAANDIVGDAKCGYSVEAGNVIEISNAIENISKLSDNERRILGLRGQEYVINNNSYDILTNRFLDVILK